MRAYKIQVEQGDKRTVCYTGLTDARAKEGVESVRIRKKGERYTPYADAYIANFERLCPPDRFISRLRMRKL